MGSASTGGVEAVLLGGIFQGSVFLPMKLTRRWHWENTWICFSTVAYLIGPGILACLLVPDFPYMLRAVPSAVLIRMCLFGVGMGAGALMMGLGYQYLGMAITYAIVLGISSSVGTLIPLLVLAPDQIFRRQGIAVIAGVAVAVLGTAVVSWAARERDAKKKTTGESKSVGNGEASARSVMVGLALCIGSGVLSSCGNLGFAFGTQISQQAHELGSGNTGSSSALWTVILLPVFLCNFSYSLYLLWKEKSGRLFRERGTVHYWGLGILMGADWIAGMVAYGAGALSLGKLGTSMGWILFISCMIAVANLLGLLTGEWKGANRRSLGIMGAGICILLLSIVVVGTAGSGG